MSHIARVGRNSWKVKTGIAVLYAVLLFGAVTTVYPFLLMVSTAMKSHVDYAEYSPQALIPRYLYDDKSLFAKYVEDKYSNNIDEINAAYDSDDAKPADVQPPKTVDAATIHAWNTFVASLPPTYTRAGFGEHDNAPSRLLLRYRDYLRTKFHNDIKELNTAWTEENVSFDSVVPPFERTALREWTPDLTNPKIRDWYDFRKTLPVDFLIVTRVDALYQRFLKEDVYEDSLDRLNSSWGINDTRDAISKWQDIPLYGRGNQSSSGDSERFLRTKFPLRMLTIRPDAFNGKPEHALSLWREFLAKRKRPGASSAELPESMPLNGDARTDFADFVATVCPLDELHPRSPEMLWQGTRLLNGSRPNESIRSPQREADWQHVLSHKGELRSEFATRNFRAVLGYILVNGRSVGNTVLFCAFSILAALIVNPMCAYALSRYPLPYAYKVLLFLLATMAFPAEVAMIPNFLLLKELGMLNTFWALVLPGLASGFSIFLLKGFFDSLPKELYESGILDGATEMTLFRRITVPLSLPIFSVIALTAFTGAYGAFLFAMVVCQNPKMWTLMVWLYNLQDTAPQYVIMAALTLAAVPTLIVFLFAQKVILRGIILPSFK